MEIVRFNIRSPRAGFTGEGAGGLTFVNGEAELSLDLDNWEPGNARGALSHFLIGGFGIDPLDGVTVEQALRDPAADAAAVQAEIEELDRQIRAENSREELESKRQQLADIRAKRAEEAKAEEGADTPAADDHSPLRSDIVPPSPDAPVSDWRAYAVEVDSTLDDKGAKSLDKATLVERYGSAYAPQGGGAA